MVAGLFVRIGVVYGHLWLSQFKTERMIEIAKREWLVSIEKYTPVQIHNGLERCKKNLTDSPPTLGQFINFIQVEIADRTPVPQKITHQESDEDRTKRRERGFNAIDKIKAMLKKTPNPKPNKRLENRFISNKDEAKALAELEAEQTEG